MLDIGVEVTEKARYRNSIRSERLLKDAFVALAANGERISVSALCRQADLNRSTFYAHYDSVDDLEARLVEDLMDGLAKVLKDTLANAFRDNPRPALEAIGSYVASNQALLKLLLTSNASFDFGDRLRRELLVTVGHARLEDEIRFDYVAGGLSSVFRTWVLEQYGSIPMRDVVEPAVRCVQNA